MTDKDIADKSIYIEPLTASVIEKIIEKETRQHPFNTWWTGSLAPAME